MASNGLLGLPLPSNPVWNLRYSIGCLLARARNGITGDSSIPGGQIVCHRRSSKRLCKRYIQGDNPSSRHASKGRGCSYLLSVHCMAGGREGPKRTLRREPVTSVKALGEGVGPNGISLGVCDADSEGGSFHILRPSKRLSTLSTASKHAGLVHFPLQRQILSVSSSAVRLGKIPSLVHPANSAIRSKSASERVQGAGLSRRLSHCSFNVWRSCEQGSMCKGTRGSRPAPSPIWIATKSIERVLGGFNPAGTPWGPHRQPLHEVLRRPAKANEGANAGQKSFERRTIWSQMGAEKKDRTPLRGLCRTFVGYALGKILHPLLVLGHVHQTSARRERESSLKPPECERPSAMETAELARIGWTADNSSRIIRSYAYRRRGRGVRWYAERGRPQPRGGWNLESSGYMELERSSRIHQLPRTEGHPSAAFWKPGKETGRGASQRLAFACGQPGRCTYHKLLCFRLPPDDARAAQTKDSARPARYPAEIRVDSIGGKQVRRWPFATLLPRRLADQEAAQAFRRGWNEGAERRISIPPSRGTPSVHAAAGVRRVGFRLEPGRSSLTLPTDRFDRGNHPQIENDEVPSNVIDPELAEASLVSGRLADGVARRRTGFSAGNSVGRIPEDQSPLEPAFVGNQHGVTGRSTRRMELADAAMVRLGSMPASRGILRSAELLSDYAWSGRTGATRNSQWRAWVEFCTAENRTILPVTEGHMIAFVGWLASERENGTRNVSSASLPQYFSAVRQMQIALTGTPVPGFPFLAHVVRAYARWEEQQYPQAKVRCGVPASVVQAVWGLGMATTSLAVLRDSAMVVFAYCLNGLRDSSVTTALATNINMTDDSILVRLSVVKGKPASQVQLVQYRRVSNSPSPVDLWQRFCHARGNHECFFGLQGERNPLSEQMTTRALLRCLDMLNISPPPGGKYSSHSLRICAHTEQVLLGFPLELRLARFGWGVNGGAEMAATYFDRTIEISPASFWVFGHPTMGRPASTAQSNAAGADATEH